MGTLVEIILEKSGSKKICFSGQFYKFLVGLDVRNLRKEDSRIISEFDICIFTCMSTIYHAGRHGEPNLKREI